MLPIILLVAFAGATGVASKTEWAHRTRGTHSYIAHEFRVLSWFAGAVAVLALLSRVLS